MSDDELGAVLAENAALRAENAAPRRLLEKNQWGGLTPPLSHGACPECSGSTAPTVIALIHRAASIDTRASSPSPGPTS